MKKKLGEFTIREAQMICRRHFVSSDGKEICVGCPFATAVRACLITGNNTDEELEMELEVK